MPVRSGRHRNPDPAAGKRRRHPGIPPELRGTYAGLGHEAATGYLRELGVTTVELLPVHQNVPEAFLVAEGLTNYWGYNTIGYLAPHNGYSAAVRAGHPGGQVAEFKTMVDALHRAGLEVILDVVFNHTAEAGPDSPTLCFRGLDNLAYYRVEPGHPGTYYDTTGCGNSLNAGDPITLQLMLDSLRYWVTEMHADGFRFDLAPTLARQDGAFDKVSAFLDMCSQDPVVCQAKLVAEPWDVGQMDSYDLGRFPPLWREWNGKYRDTMREFWRSHPVGIGEFANRFTGSADLYATVGRRPTSSVNLITVHDGFTLADLVSYDDKHNEANGENNRDGTSDNYSWNCGAEGPTSDPDILALRARQSRALLTTLMLSFGVPMLLGGDEMGRTQGGNNNAYCQDNEITWFDWASADTALQDYTKQLIAFRLAHPVFRRRFLAGAETSELQWFTPAGTLMDGGDWADPNARTIAIYLDGIRCPRPGRRRHPPARRRLPGPGQLLVGPPRLHPAPHPPRRGMARRNRHLRPRRPRRSGQTPRRRPGNRQPPIHRRALRAAPRLTSARISRGGENVRRPGQRDRKKPRSPAYGPRGSPVNRVSSRSRAAAGRGSGGAAWTGTASPAAGCAPGSGRGPARSRRACAGCRRTGRTAST